jgi:hypothetical protein
MQFKSKWVKFESPILEDKNRCNCSYDSSIKYSIPLKPRINAVIDLIDIEVSKLNVILKDLKSKDNETFGDGMSPIKEEDYNTSNQQYCGVYLSDPIQKRKLIKMISLSKAIFENINIKLDTISNIADLVSMLSSAIALVKNIRSFMISYLPESKEEVGSISELMGGILIDAGQIEGHVINFETANEEASRQMEEASLIAEQKIKEEFPSLLDL